MRMWLQNQENTRKGGRSSSLVAEEERQPCNEWTSEELDAIEVDLTKLETTPSTKEELGKGNDDIISGISINNLFDTIANPVKQE